MKKSAAKEPLLNTLARQVGHAAGTIAKAAQNLASDAVAVVKTDAAKPTAPRTKAAKKTKRRVVSKTNPKQKKKAAKPGARKSRTPVRKSSKR